MKNNQKATKSMQNYPAFKELMRGSTIYREHLYFFRKKNGIVFRLAIIK